MAVNANELVSAGLAYPLAVEVARQMNAGLTNGSAAKLMAVGFPVEHAKELARQINAGSFDSHKLALAHINPSLAHTLKRLSGL